MWGFVLVQAVIGVLIFVFILTQVIIPLCKRQSIFPMFRDRGKIENEIFYQQEKKELDALREILNKERDVK